MNNNEGTTMNEIALFTQSQMDKVNQTCNELRVNLDVANRNIVESLKSAHDKEVITLPEMLDILEGAKVPRHYYAHLFMVTVMIEIEATSTVTVTKSFEVEVEAGYDEYDLLSAFDEQHGLTASEIVSDNTWDADWCDDGLDLLSSEEV
jgi:hypothetical protein